MKCLTAILIFILFLSCDSDKNASNSKQTLPKTAKSNTSVIKISTEEYAPFISKELKNNGYLAQVISEAFMLEGIKAEFDYLPAARSFESAKSGEYDASVPWAKRTERIKDFYFGEPLIESDVEVFFFLEGNEFEWDAVKQDYSLLQGKVIGAITGANYGEKFMTAEREGVIKVDRVTHTTQNLRKLATNRIDLMISPEKIALHGLKIEKEKYKALQSTKVIQAIKEPIEYDYLIISKNSKNGAFFNKSFNRGMKKLKSSGRYKELFKEFEKSLKE